MLPEAVLLLCAEIQNALHDGKLAKKENECISLPGSKFREIVLGCRKKWKDAWSKEFREMDEDRLLDAILEYMEQWMMLTRDGDDIILLPAAGRTAGFYPKDFAGGTKD